MLSRRLSLLLAALVLLPLTPLSAQPEPGVFELLAETREAYARLPSYQDHGEIETILSGFSVRHRFELSAAPGSFRFLLERDLDGEPQRRVIWKSGGEAFHSDSRLGQYKAVTSLPEEVAGALGEGGADALVVPVTLAGGADALADPDVATLEGNEPCGASTCWVVFLSRATGAVESRLWIDSRTFLIRQVEVQRHDTGEVVDRAMAEAGLAVRGAAPGARQGTVTIRVRHEIEAAGKPLQRAEATFGPPPGARRVTEWQVSGRDAMPELGEEITVALATVTVRVVDNYGRPVQGLAPGDFRVMAKGKEIPVVALDWVSSAGTAAPPADTSATSEGSPLAAPGGDVGKRVIFFVQADNEPTRIKGQMRLRPHTRELLDSFPAADRLAVVSYDSHLKLWQDFTDDREAVHQAIDQAMLFGGDRRTVVRPSRDRSSLAAHFDFDGALKTASPERALQLTAEALQPLPGEKVMIYLGYGLGRYGTGGVHMTPDYRPAIEALDAARVTVFVLDVTDADYHSLEVGLQSVAYQTGGTYAKTHIFPKQATDILAGTVSSHYLLTLDRAALPPQGAKVRITLRDKKGTVYYARPDPVPGMGKASQAEPR